jgi:hypothetical protein
MRIYAPRSASIRAGLLGVVLRPASTEAKLVELAVMHIIAVLQDIINCQGGMLQVTIKIHAAT